MYMSYISYIWDSDRDKIVHLKVDYSWSNSHKREVR